VRQHNLVIQPDNRGTGAAILYSLARLSILAPTAYVALFPSDHFVSDERHFMRHAILFIRPPRLGHGPNATNYADPRQRPNEVAKSDQTRAQM